ncbi:putative RNA polymerase II subunit B1 CTD phosphatase RPAP2 isoform X2 [Prorops nasuta]|uniref:putative RNA polymerase II subunit B1 CTD phosphatase RPAP2 isoform X2 n=1 Tax=Prorops nasuta TaxID=863751 RepID=UPI0034CDD6A0
MMNSPEKHLVIHQNVCEKRKIIKKMSKAQMQLASLKKNKCEAKALMIVEHLLEPNISSDWLLQNLIHINKSHMEDVIEERVITKLCGYVLCQNTLTAIINQQYHISTQRNKVYNVSQRKKFCSSHCYGAARYLLEQMLIDPLWLRDKDKIPIFKLMPQEEFNKCTPGEEVNVTGIDITLSMINNSNINKEKNESQEKIGINNVQNNDINIKTSDNDITSNINNEKQILKIKNFIEEKACDTSKNCSSLQYYTLKERDFLLTRNITENMDNRVIEESIDLNEPKSTNAKEPIEHFKDPDLRRNPIIFTDIKLSENSTAVIQSKDNMTNNSTIFQHKKSEKLKQKITSKSLEEQVFQSLVCHVERSVKEWVNKNTLCYLFGDVAAKQECLEIINQYDKYKEICKRLNKLQLEDEQQDRDMLTSNVLNPVPHIADLQEKGKLMDLKVRAFYEGNLVIKKPEDTKENSDKEEFFPILPLTNIHHPNVLRRRILTDKLNKILPDLLLTLVGNHSLHLPTQYYTYNVERSSKVKALVNSFSLSSKNILFKAAEWNLVGLIIIKMLSMIDSQIRSLLHSKQASAYISMILMSYKLDSNYLNNLFIDLCSK